MAGVDMNEARYPCRLAICLVAIRNNATESAAASPCSTSKVVSTWLGAHSSSIERSGRPICSRARRIGRGSRRTQRALAEAVVDDAGEIPLHLDAGDQGVSIARELRQALLENCARGEREWLSVSHVEVAEHGRGLLGPWEHPERSWVGHHLDVGRPAQAWYREPAIRSE